VTSWADHAILWHVYPLGFTGAEAEANAISGIAERADFAPLQAEGVPALDARPLTAITQSPAFRVHASETLGSDTLTIYERI